LTGSEESGTVIVVSDRGMMKKKTQRGTAHLLRRRERLIEGLPDLREVLRGSLVTRYRRCGRANCHCAREGDPGHGPAYYLVVTVAPGQTLQVYVPRAKREEVEKWISNFNRARHTLEEISSVNRTLLVQGKLFVESENADHRDR
jgi:hypothetical protein